MPVDYPERRKPVKPAGKKNVKRRLTKLENSLYGFGFIDRSLEELEKMAADRSSSYRQKSAAWVLALWYANRGSEADARRALEFLAVVVRGEKNSKRLRRAAVIESECRGTLGDTQKAREMILSTPGSSSDANLFLAAANLEPAAPDRIRWINKAFRLHGISEIKMDSSLNLPPFDCLKPEGEQLHTPTGTPGETPKVTVIVTAYNAEATIKTALDSVLWQTWRNLEVLVVDDCSIDGTAAVVEEYVAKDPRVALIRAQINRGTYAARNMALEAAVGDFVTTHDADDWSHPGKIERQALHLMKNPSVIGNISRVTRAAGDLSFKRCGNPGFYIHTNLSTLMFRRVPVMQDAGCWDSMRISGDSEFRSRLIKVYGKKAVVSLRTGPLSLLRYSSQSLTGNDISGYCGYYMGKRREYRESYKYYHATAENLRNSFPQHHRPFPVPEPLWPDREFLGSGRRKFDVIIASDFSLTGGTTSSNAEEIKAQKRMGLRTGLIHMPRYDASVGRKINPKIRRLLDGDRVQMLVHGEKATCDLLVIRHPPVLQELQRYLPDVEASSICVIVNQPPKLEYSPKGRLLYDLETCVKHLRHYFGKPGTWHPNGPLVRKTLFEQHAEDLFHIALSGDDWVNIIDVEEWRRAERPPDGRKIRIGRHSRDHYTKWPADPEELLSIYPDSAEYEIHVLGGAKAPGKVLGYLPENWHVLAFGKKRPQDFLAMLDLFVYYTHPYWVESSARVIIEAMAAGVPVILPHVYHEQFGEAAAYAEPPGVKDAIDQLMNDPYCYASQVKKTRCFVEENFGYAKHAARLAKYLGLKL